ncbi:surface lipoprotein assembly modifier [Dokdonella sp.]|uniref:surface lipoprotein assembly modifier n=1 Tax=Dokdonella sp. TaxID=2291710 RepID=UPI002F406197
MRINHCGPSFAGAAFAAVAIAAAGAPSARAEPALGYTVGVELEQNDNINLSRDEPVEETVLTPTLAFDLKQQGAVLSATAAGALSYRDYLGGKFSDELRGLLSGVATWSISPERFDWVAEDYLGRQPVDVLQADVPSNQQQTNVFSTGPTLRARFGGDLRGRLDLRYTNTYAEETSEFNSDRFSAAARLAWLLGALDNVSGSLTASRVRYDEVASRPFDYDREDAYIGYEHVSGTLKLDAAAGYSWVDLRGPDSRSGALLSLGLRWMPSPATDLGVNAARQFADASQDLVVDPLSIGNLGVGSGRNGAVISPQLYVEKRIGLDFNHRADRYAFNVAPFWRKIDYIEGEFFSQRSYGWTARYDWLLRPTFTLSLSTGREHRDYTGLDRTDTDASYSMALAWRQTSHWTWMLRGTHALRDSTLREAGYSDNAIILSLTYTR